MFRYRFLRSAAIALALYGVLGVVIAAALLVVGVGTFRQVSELQQSLDSERVSLVQSIRTVSRTVADTAASTDDFTTSIEGARSSADAASNLANQTAGTFRQLASGLDIQLFGLRPFAAVGPQFNRSADQLQQLAISLGTTRDALAQNRNDVSRVGADLLQLQRQLDAVANALQRPGILGAAQQLLPFQVAFYGVCLLVLLQSIFSLIAGVALFRLSRALGSEPLLPHLGRRALPPPEPVSLAERT
jgi:hypothetical protein